MRIGVLQIAILLILVILKCHAEGPYAPAQEPGTEAPHEDGAEAGEGRRQSRGHPHQADAVWQAPARHPGQGQ